VLSRFVRLCVPLVLLCLASVFLPTPVDATPVPTFSPSDAPTTPPELTSSLRKPPYNIENKHPLGSPSPVHESMWAAAARGSAGKWPASNARSLNTLSNMDGVPPSVATTPPPSPYLVVPSSMLTTAHLPVSTSASSSSKTKPRAPTLSPYWVPGNSSAGATAGATAEAAVGGEVTSAAWQCSDALGYERACHILLVSIGLHDHVVPLARLAAKLLSRVSESRGRSVICF